VTVALWISVGLVSGAGAMLRFALHTAVQRRVQTVFPLGTLAVNLAGSLALGLLHGLGVTGDALLLLGTALLGSFTTFSTWMLESESLREGDEGSMAAVNVVASLALGLAAVALGWAVGATL
jgi:fluoride exporter